jgi:tRNA(fMet)-specific endonuclease VapC
MDKYLLDTNTCIFYFKKKYNVDKRLQQAGFENCAISEITLAELFYGAECSVDVAKNMAIIRELTGKITIVPVFDALAVYAKEKHSLKQAGTIIDDLDIFIGATAIANNMIMVTDNEKHLGRLSKIRIENWVER